MSKRYILKKKKFLQKPQDTWFSSAIPFLGVYILMVHKNTVLNYFSSCCKKRIAARERIRHLCKWSCCDCSLCHYRHKKEQQWIHKRLAGGRGYFLRWVKLRPLQRLLLWLSLSTTNRMRKQPLFHNWLCYISYFLGTNWIEAFGIRFTEFGEFLSTLVPFWKKF